MKELVSYHEDRFETQELKLQQFWNQVLALNSKVKSNEKNEKQYKRMIENYQWQ